MKASRNNWSLLTAGFALTFQATAFGQGTFGNLNFEAANVAGYPHGYGIPTSAALPGWTAYNGSPGTATNILTEIWYDSISLGGEMISVNDTNRGSGFVPFQGKFSAALNGIIPNVPPPDDTFAAIGQTGQVPAGSLSLVFWANSVSSLQVSFGGSPIPLVQLGSGANYLIVAGDISSFAGQTGELLFIALPHHGSDLDNIQFSNQPIPEPSTFGLFTLGTLLLVSRKRRSEQAEGAV